jgi:hypothetical protein
LVEPWAKTRQAEDANAYTEALFMIDAFPKKFICCFLDEELSKGSRKYFKSGP